MTTNLTEDEIIEEIIKSFETLALGDIKYNVEKPDAKPIAAFILCSCLIDQLAVFVYNPPPFPKSKNKDIYEQFIAEYLPQYVPLDLYVNLRCNLVHNYTIGQYLSITSDNIVRQDHTTIIHAQRLYDDLKAVFEKIKIQLMQIGSPQRTNARDRYMIGKIITSKPQVIRSYTIADCEKLVAYYLEELKPHLPNFKNFKKVDAKRFPTDNPDYHCIIFHLEADGKEIDILLDDIIKLINLEDAELVLERLNGSQDGSPQ